MNTISTVLIVIAVMLMMRFFAKNSKQAPLVDGENYTVLRLSVLFEIIGWVGAVMITFLAIGIFFFSAKGTTVNSTSDIVGAIFGIIVFAGFLFLSICLILSRRKSFVRFNNEKIEVYGIFAKTKELYWKNVTKVVFTKNRTLKLTDGAVKVGVSYSLIGFQSFVEKMKEKIAPEIVGDSIEKIEKMYKYLGVNK